MPRATKPVPTAVVVDLAEPVRARLRRLTTSVTAQVRQVLRAKIVLAAADGLPNTTIARELKVSVNAVRKWRGRFAAGGLAALKFPRDVGHSMLMPRGRVLARVAVGSPVG